MAPLGRRIAARLIDCWILGFTLLAVWGLGFHLTTGDCNGVSRCYGFAGFGTTLVVVVIGAVATVFYEFVGLTFWGTTIGKSALGLRVTRSEHDVASVSPKRGWRTAAIAGATTFAATAVGIGVLIWALMAAGGQELSGSEKQSYIQDNQQLLESLPQLPGSQRLDLQSLPYCTNGAIVGYRTEADYRMPAQMSHQDIVDFYVRDLGGTWQYTVTNTPIEMPRSAEHPYGATDIATSAQFKRDSATVFVTIQPTELNAGVPPNSYNVVVDSHRIGYSCHED